MLIDEIIHYISERFNISKIKKIKLDKKIINSIRIRYIYISKDFIKKQCSELFQNWLLIRSLVLLVILNCGQF